MGNEHSSPIKKNEGVYISRSLLIKIAFGLLAIISIIAVLIHFNSGLTHKKAKELFNKYIHNNVLASDVFLIPCENVNVQILGMKKIKTNTYLVKIQFCGKVLQDPNIPTSWLEQIIDADFTFSKWDTGWFIEKKLIKVY